MHAFCADFDQNLEEVILAHLYDLFPCQLLVAMIPQLTAQNKAG